MSIEIQKQVVSEWLKVEPYTTMETPWFIRKYTTFGIKKPTFYLDFQTPPQKGEVISIKLEEHMEDPKYNMLPGITNLLIVNVVHRDTHSSLRTDTVLEVEIINPPNS